jgi:hypothetical protein
LASAFFNFGAISRLETAKVKIREGQKSEESNEKEF